MIFNAAFQHFGKALVSFLSLVMLASCKPSQPRESTFWIYTSTYKEVIAEYQAPLQAAFPDLKFEWFQAGSETVGAKIRAEIQSGKVQADLGMTSDLLFFESLRVENHLVPLDPSLQSTLPKDLVAPDGAYAISRFPVMMIAYNKNALKVSPPESFKDLSHPRFRNLLTMPSPLESGTALTTILYLHQKYGASYFSELRAQDILVAGGNGATLSRIQSGEKPVGIVLSENVLSAKSRGVQSLELVHPKDGALLIPSPVALLKKQNVHPKAQQIAAWFFSAQAQQILRKNGVYGFALSSPDNVVQGLPPAPELRATPWSLATFAGWLSSRNAIRNEFESRVLKQ